MCRAISTRTGDSAEVCAGDIRIRVVELRCVGNRKRFRTEFQVQPLLNGEAPEDGTIQVKQAGSADHVASQIAEGQGRRGREVRPIQPKCANVGAAQNVDWAGGVKGVAIARCFQARGAVTEVQRGTGGKRQDAVKLPAAQNRASNTVLEELLVLAEREFPNVALNEIVAAVEIRACPVPPGVDVIGQALGFGLVALGFAPRICRGNRKALVEAAIHFNLQRIIAGAKSYEA